jgi:ATP-dependent exoDNAse (exonuclease V) beta subunit
MAIKKHVSFSELKTWIECPYKHKLAYIDNIKIEKESHYLDYGTILHATIEHFLKTKEMNIESAMMLIDETWAAKGFDSPEYIKQHTENAEAARWKYTHSDVEEHKSWARNNLSSLASFLEEQFGEWEFVSAEENLFEPTGHQIDGEDFSFKGFIDAIIKSKKPDARGKIKTKYWILDWKTASAGGWALEKQQDIKTWGQLAFYKKYWTAKNALGTQDVGCAFILLKKTAKDKKSLSRIDVSVGPKTIEKVEKPLNRFIMSRGKSLAIKNKMSCRFCDFRGTIHCDSKSF